MTSPRPKPIPVDIVHLPADWWNRASAVAVVLAFVLALLAYRKIAKERRTVFELEVLRDLLGRLGGSTFVTSAPARALLEALPSEDLRLWRRIATAVEDQPLAQERERAVVRAILDADGVPQNDVNPDDRLWRACVEEITVSIAARTDQGWWKRLRRSLMGPRGARPAPPALDVDRLAEQLAEKVATKLAQSGADQPTTDQPASH